MDDLIYELFDLVSELLGWVLPLIGKFWFLILAYLGYKVFGQSAKKSAQGQRRRSLTPVESGGFPTPPQAVERKAVRASSRYEPVQQETWEDEGWDRPRDLDGEKERERLAQLKRTKVKTVASEPALEPKPALDLDPREGMKWALIFGEPRSKRPYTSPTTRGRSE